MAPAKAGAFSIGKGNESPPANLVRSAVEGAYRKDLGINGAKSFTKNLALCDPNGQTMGRLISGQPLIPGDRLVLSRAYHDSLPIDISKPPLSKTVNTINNIIRDFSIFRRKGMPGIDNHPLITAFEKNIGPAATENLFRRAQANDPALFRSIEKLYHGETLTLFDTRILGHHLESIAKANDPYIASEIGSRAEKAFKVVTNQYNTTATAIPNTPYLIKGVPDNIESALSKPYPTLKSTKQAEAYAKVLGVNASYANHINIANEINQWLYNLKKQGRMLPEKIEILESMFKDNRVHAQFNHHEGRIYINPKSIYWNNGNLSKYAKSMEGKWSTTRRWHPLEHEFAHLNHFYNNPSRYLELDSYSNIPIDRVEMIERQVSEYAATHPIEFVAEVYVGLKQGIKYPPIIMDWYNEYGGPKI